MGWKVFNTGPSEFVVKQLDHHDHNGNQREYHDHKKKIRLGTENSYLCLGNLHKYSCQNAWNCFSWLTHDVMPGSAKTFAIKCMPLASNAKHIMVGVNPFQFEVLLIIASNGIGIRFWCRQRQAQLEVPRQAHSNRKCCLEEPSTEVFRDTLVQYKFLKHWLTSILLVINISRRFQPISAVVKKVTKWMYHYGVLVGSRSNYRFQPNTTMLLFSKRGVQRGFLSPYH